MESRLEKTEATSARNEAKVNDLERQLTTLSTSGNSSLDADKVLAEINEQNIRAPNLILFNLPETSTEVILSDCCQT